MNALDSELATKIALGTDRLAQASAGQTISRQQRQWIDALVHLGDDAGERIGEVPEAMLRVIDHPGDVQATCRDCGSPQSRTSNRCEWCPAGVVEWFSGDGRAYRVKEEDAL